MSDDVAVSDDNLAAISGPTKFTTGAENKGGEDKAIQWSMDMAIEEQYVTITQKM